MPRTTQPMKRSHPKEGVVDPGSIEDLVDRVERRVRKQAEEDAGTLLVRSVDHVTSGLPAEVRQAVLDRFVNRQVQH